LADTGSFVQCCYDASSVGILPWDDPIQIKRENIKQTVEFEGKISENIHSY